MAAINKLLVVGPSWVGDMVMAQSLYQLLAAEDPSRAIDVLAPAWSLPLLKRMPEVAEGIELPLGHGELGIAARRRLGRSLRGRYSRAIVLPRSFKSALVPWFAGVAQRTGFRGEWRYGLINDMRSFDPRRLDQTVKRFVALGLPRGDESLPEPGEPRLGVDPQAQRRAVERLGLDADRPIVALMPGAEYGPAKQWPPAYFAKLASRVAALDASVWIFGSAKEAALGREIASAAGAAGVRSIAGDTTLVEAVDLLALADVALSNDSGLMHIAAAVGTHTIAIYGSSTPDFTPPLTANATVHYRRLACSPCFERECPLGHLDCLTGITVDEVYAGIERQLDSQAQSH